MPRGGYQRPSNPAPVSGPGKLSRRTDGGPTQGAKYMGGGKYGEASQLMQQQQSAPMSAAAKQSAPKPQLPAGPAIAPLTSPTERPNEPLTTGMPFGPGAGPEVLNLGQNGNQRTSDVIRKLIPFDDTGQLGELYNYLTSRGL